MIMVCTQISRRPTFLRTRFERGQKKKKAKKRWTEHVSAITVLLLLWRCRRKCRYVWS